MILANLVPALPFVILVMTPFIEQIDPNLEAAARIFGANTWRYFRYVLLPLLVPGMLAAGLLVLVRTIGMFELTFFTAGPSTQTLVVALYYAVFSTGVRAPQSIDAMAMIYMAITLVWVVIALQFVADAARQPREAGAAIGERDARARDAARASVQSVTNGYRAPRADVADYAAFPDHGYP